MQFLPGPTTRGACKGRRPQSHEMDVSARQAHAHPCTRGDEQGPPGGENGGQLDSTLIYDWAGTVSCPAHEDCRPTFKGHGSVNAATQVPLPPAPRVHWSSGSCISRHRRESFHVLLNVLHTSCRAVTAPGPADAAMTLFFWGGGSDQDELAWPAHLYRTQDRLFFCWRAPSPPPAAPLGDAMGWGMMEEATMGQICCTAISSNRTSWLGWP